MKLSSRLQCVADQVPSDACLIDIGTDHGLLPGILLHRNRIRKGIAIDVNKRPLQKAKLLRATLGLEPVAFATILANGLQGVSIPESSVVCIAGMGARKMTQIPF